MHEEEKNVKKYVRLYANVEFISIKLLQFSLVPN